MTNTDLWRHKQVAWRMEHPVYGNYHQRHCRMFSAKLLSAVRLTTNCATLSPRDMHLAELRCNFDRRDR
jgi:hypothetical protein